MNKKVTNVTNLDVLKELTNQNEYCDVTAWNVAGITGKIVVIWNMEQYINHILDVTSGATVLNGNMNSSDNGKEIKYAKIVYQKISETNIQYYELEDFIRDFNVKIILRSFGG